ncbi:tuftelin 1a isoform X1 [Brienomyrus brachyistius]|uniref:tuftelin 1a isoform X1 n=2 Tax=Brienomyrus brachyistius TaxID=42636 RepID=UPI0020B3CD9C|nr:tuftelin 1a isoform X1 [Brienomyrus brachyistius]XP_048881079.1 tuftelin 1a isoform X1 [Brienomyrus brachyistius]
MHGMSRSLCTFSNSLPDGRGKDKCPRLRLTLQDQTRPAQKQPDHDPDLSTSKPAGLSFALVQPSNGKRTLLLEKVKPTQEKVEVIKVYLEGSAEKEAEQRESLKMLSDEVSQIQEVRFCLKTLREQMAARNKANNNQADHKPLTNGHGVHLPNGQSAVSKHSEGWAIQEIQDWEDEQESSKIREVSRRLYAQLQEAERRHQEEKEKLQEESLWYQQQLGEQTERFCRAERGLEERDRQVEDLQRLLRGMEAESAALQEKMKASEEQLLEMHAYKEGQCGKNKRSEELEKEVAILKEKIHHLDDMLKSQQRKVRHMIEQLQNSRTVIQERDRVIRELEEKVAYLEAENKEMRDQMDYVLGGQKPASYLPPERNSQIVYSKQFQPSTQSSKTLPFIKVIEIKS